MMQFKSNSYKRYYRVSLFALLGLVLMLIAMNLDKKVYKVYIEDRLVGVTTDSPEVIEKTYNEVKAKRYAQGADIIKEELVITEEEQLGQEEVLTHSQLEDKLYVELEQEEIVPAISVVQGKTFQRQVPNEIVYVEDASLYVGESKVLVEGREGTQEITVHKSIDSEGVTKEKVVENHMVKDSQPRVIAVGVKEKPAYMVPVEDYVFTSPFGPRWGRSHEGIDLAVSTGTPVAAAADGVVIQSGWNGGYGISIYVDHGNGIITRYGHLSQAYAQVGRSVKQGETIGLSGNTGNSTGPHLHFEIRIGDEAVNPVNYVDIEY